MLGEMVLPDVPSAGSPQPSTDRESRTCEVLRGQETLDLMSARSREGGEGLSKGGAHTFSEEGRCPQAQTVSARSESGASVCTLPPAQKKPEDQRRVSESKF